jgi:hypothetical protein
MFSLDIHRRRLRGSSAEFGGKAGKTHYDDRAAVGHAPYFRPGIADYGPSREQTEATVPQTPQASDEIPRLVPRRSVSEPASSMKRRRGSEPAPQPGVKTAGGSLTDGRSRESSRYRTEIRFRRRHPQRPAAKIPAASRSRPQSAVSPIFEKPKPREMASKGHRICFQASSAIR